MSQKQAYQKAPIPGLYQRGEWWSYRKEVDGKRVWIPLKTRDRNEAIRMAIELRDQKPLAPSDAWKVEVNAYIEARAKAGRLSVRTQETKRRFLENFGERFKLSTPRDVTPAIVRKFVESPGLWKKEALAVSTLVSYFNHLRTFLSWCVDRGQLRENPCAGIQIEEVVDDTRDVFVPSHEVAQLIDAAPDETLRLILMLGFECGMRRGEIDAARPEWVDMERGVLVIPARSEAWRRKNRRRAIVPLTRRLRDYFQEHGLNSPYLVAPEKAPAKWRYRFDFEHRWQVYMRSKGYADAECGGCRHRWTPEAEAARKRCPECGSGEVVYDPVTIHDMRRSFGSNRVSAGVSIEKVANWMGIDVKTAWKRYARFIPVDSSIELGAA